MLPKIGKKTRRPALIIIFTVLVSAIRQEKQKIYTRNEGNRIISITKNMIVHVENPKNLSKKVIRTNKRI